jgi:hypothetical protein
MPIDIKSGIFWEKQTNGLCRMHSINAYFGKTYITPNVFNKYIDIYDNYLTDRFNVITSSRAFDLVNSDQTNIVSYILKRHGIHLRYYALNTLYHKPLDQSIKQANVFFVYNFGHIWTVRKKDGVYYKVDSLSGVTSFNITCLNRLKDIGIMLPVELCKEFTTHIHKLKNITYQNQANTRHGIILYLKKLHDKKNILGCMEIPLGVSISILETNLLVKRNKNEFHKIDALVNKYNSFLHKFTKGRYNDINLILQYIPDILLELYKLHDL